MTENELIELKKTELLTLARKHGQEHIFHFWNVLTIEQKEKLIGEVKKIDFSDIEKKLANAKSNNNTPIEEIYPPKVLKKNEMDEEILLIGEKTIKEGKVAILMVSGGQGSRLGYKGPKGCLPISPIKKKSLFEIFSHKIIAVNKKYKTNIEFYIMTSNENNNETIKFFEKNNFFGLKKENVVFFKQISMPAVDLNEKIIMKNEFEIYQSPTGTGGVFSALKKGGILDRMSKKGIEHIQYIQVDNPLVTICDPYFIGNHIFRSAEWSLGVIQKEYPEERVGVVVKTDDKTKIVEYIHMPEKLSKLKTSEGKLAFRAATHAVHLISLNFLKKIDSLDLPIYLAKKKIPSINLQREFVTPLEPNANKFESFVFDALQFANEVVVFEVERAEEFAPVKNNTGKDSVETSKRGISAKNKSWLKAAGISPITLNKIQNLEISPIFAHTKEDFIKKIKPHLTLIEKSISKEGNYYLS